MEGVEEKKRKKQLEYTNHLNFLGVWSTIFINSVANNIKEVLCLAHV